MKFKSQTIKNNVKIIGNLQSHETLLFVHGFGSDQQIWHLITPAFIEQYKIILLDNIGAGLSDKESFQQHHYLKIETYANDIISIVNELALSDLIIIGHSIGAMISALATIQTPAQFKKLIMIGASPCYQNIGDYHGGLTKKDIDNIYASVIANFDTWVAGFTKAAFDYYHDTDIAKAFTNTLHTYDKEYILTVLCSIFQTDYRYQLANVRVPTLIIQSTNDYFVPNDVATYMNKAIPDSKLHYIESYGHFPHVISHIQIIDSIRDFIQQ